MKAILPFIAGCLHLNVFYHSITSIYTVYSTNYTGTSEFRNNVFSFDSSIFIAYVFDLMCCQLSTIPFSRCNKSKDIYSHHVPTLILALPLAVPLWMGWGTVDGANSILDLSLTNEVRNNMIAAFTLASGFAYISSLNEVIMCFQRVEMTLGGVTQLHDPGLHQMKYRFFTSKFIIGFELCYKLCFFWGLSVMACKACCDFDKSLIEYFTTRDDQGSMLTALLSTYSSPAVLRGALFRLFSIAMYPSMGSRSLKKIQQHLNGKKDSCAKEEVQSIVSTVSTVIMDDSDEDEPNDGMRKRNTTKRYPNGDHSNSVYPNQDVELPKSQ